jgi:hypothetical protein
VKKNCELFPFKNGPSRRRLILIWFSLRLLLPKLMWCHLFKQNARLDGWTVPAELAIDEVTGSYPRRSPLGET